MKASSLGLSWVRTRAPVRVLDAGGWSDTWFAGQGRVCHLCVGPGAEALVRRKPSAAPGAAELLLRVPEFGEEYAFSHEGLPGRHPLLEATLLRWAPPASDLEVEVSCSVPAGSSLGTSAAVVVALIAALQALEGVEPAPATIARAAHDVETVDLGRQSGVQDQVAAAFGGANFVRVAPYPHFDVSPLPVHGKVMEALSERLLTVYLGAHDSSNVHLQVIQRLTSANAACLEALEELRRSAGQAASALVSGDLAAYGEAMVVATEAQARLGPTIVNPDASRLIEIAAKRGAVGWKVNGAGGPGGSLSVIAGEDRAALQAALEAAAPVRALALYPSEWGARVVDAG